MSNYSKEPIEPINLETIRIYGYQLMLAEKINEIIAALPDQPAKSSAASELSTTEEPKHGQ